MHLTYIVLMDNETMYVLWNEWPAGVRAVLKAHCATPIAFSPTSSALSFPVLETKMIAVSRTGDGQAMSIGAGGSRCTRLQTTALVNTHGLVRKIGGKRGRHTTNSSRAVAVTMPCASRCCRRVEGCRPRSRAGLVT